jgi:hypothetical protein
MNGRSLWVPTFPTSNVRTPAMVTDAASPRLARHERPRVRREAREQVTPIAIDVDRDAF